MVGTTIYHFKEIVVKYIHEHNTTKKLLTKEIGKI
jgi:hypothetical protein